MNTAIETQALSKVFTGRSSLLGRPAPAVHAIQPVNLTILQGEVLGVVGESGCGKSTLARMLVGLLAPSSGNINIFGNELTGLQSDPAAFGRLIQYVFQDPLSSLNPRKTIRQILEAPLKYLLHLSSAEREARVSELLDAVNLRIEFLDRYPHEFSGGQAQRIGIARALAANPRILVLDEPVSALDVSVQAQVLNLLSDLRETYDLTYVFISHDLAVVEAVSDRVAVFYFGALVELSDANTIFRFPRHPYTQLLLSSAPAVGKDLPDNSNQDAELPDPLAPPVGCAFAARCNRVEARCEQEAPLLDSEINHDNVACFNPIKHES